jgi:hypothetical protein
METSVKNELKYGKDKKKEKVQK